MLKGIVHIGITVSDMERSVSFYRDVLGLEYKGELMMEGPEAEMLFCCAGCKVRVAYLNGSPELACAAGGTDSVFAAPVESGAS